jgi:preprotein translocase subunit SecE
MKKVFQFFIDSKNELLKVVWPTRKQTIEMTIAVIIIVVIVSLYLGGLDYLLTKGITFLLKK